MTVYKQKSTETNISVLEFIENIDHPSKRDDAFQLLDLFTETTGYEAKMWGPSIIGFGSYHYKYESGHEGDAPLTGFPPGKRRSACICQAKDVHRNPEEIEVPRVYRK
ncbi:hypothetical protein M2105_000257 [Paenibacillus sp. PastF-1]|nr:hypothetical protein [Paenibacillus sp. PastF-2]MDF9845842.1 hypothetical protein [Paenibacillus sp. PastM-2]MDF9852415.1 hypothetical protein [Paenibacillus sp. PastF-1]MDH6477855.1 hypothetical protein [Paenibacillus sp. PastH-2]MDH6505594.1 hypothetical protein [Paenibacillus sp. PastM-3]